MMSRSHAGLFLIIFWLIALAFSAPGIAMDTETNAGKQEEPGPFFCEELCVICLGTKPETIIFPCLHQCLCIECAAGFAKEIAQDEDANDICPICRTEIEQIDSLVRLRETSVESNYDALAAKVALLEEPEPSCLSAFFKRLQELCCFCEIPAGPQIVTHL